MRPGEPTTAVTAAAETGPVDDAGRRHRPAGPEARIVSLVPSITELLFDLDLGPQVVGRTAFCVHPRGAVRRARSVGGTKQVNLARIATLAPTHVVVNVDETPRQLAETLAGLGLTVVVTHPLAPRDNLRLYRLLGRLFGRRDRAEALCGRFEAAYREVVAAASTLPSRRVLYLIWKDPWMTIAADTYIAGILALVGWQPVAAGAGGRYPVVTLGEALLAKADLVLFSSEPFPFGERHLKDFRRAFPAHADKAAMIDGALVSWYGSRAIAGLRYLEELARARK
jgi:ABC-type Fe3+-hydroxamate transport system substrate-binding protein